MGEVVVGDVGGGVCGGDSAFFVGPCGGTLRPSDGSLRWAGLSVGDELVLGQFLEWLGVVPDELHTNVPLGWMPDGEEVEGDVAWRRMLVDVYASKCDAALRFGCEWWIVECKPRASLHGLGQLLGYCYLWECCCAEKRACRLILACTEGDAHSEAACAACGVDVVVVGGQLFRLWNGLQ